ncbi:hypothetical protein K466DRAFT_665176 [Polyporus arcularius HHB13444]|uniref:Uncharacterized protein n=1 Tax=Polyporus arcularius HHB13444 TaxID=1314778 RepID=A0A5C3PEV8_9APHY|nr:hypothetical protein K466DRAFT_665176 [Polyporus arcularius HHB13444]
MPASQRPSESEEVKESLPVSSHTCTVLLGPGEEIAVRTHTRRTFRGRVCRGAYTYVFFSARALPLPVYGTSGDLWLCTTPGAEDIYCKNREERWVPLARGTSGTKATRHVNHPWLGKRILQFDGHKLGWFCSNEWLRSRSSWDQWLRLQVAVPPHPDLSVKWIARYLAHRMASTTMGTVPDVAHATSSTTSTSPSAAAPVLETPPSSSKRATTSSSSNARTMPAHSSFKTTSSSKENAPLARAPPSGPRGLERTHLMTTLLSSHIGPVPLRNTANTTAVDNIVVPQSRATKKAASTLPAKPEPTAVVTADSHTVIIKREEEDGVPPPLRGKRRRSVSMPDEAPLKRVKTEDDENTARELLVRVNDRDEDVALSSAVPPVAEYDRGEPELVLTPAGRSSPAKKHRAGAAVESFLASLPIPLDHHSSLFDSLGIASMAYIESIASMPQHVLNELIFALQDHGLSFVEALVLRDALDELPVDRNSSRNRPRSTADAPVVRVDVFLDSLRPSMKHHASTFWELGLYTSAHMSTLGKTEAHRYAEVETTLRGEGLSWMDCFIVRIAVQARR